jgi:hypothetical protein
LVLAYNLINMNFAFLKNFPSESFGFVNSPSL